MELTFSRKYEVLSIYIDGIIHLRIKMGDLVCFKSWVDGDCEYYIKYYFKGGVEMKGCYEGRDLWIRVLGILNDKCL